MTGDLQLFLGEVEGHLKLIKKSGELTAEPLPRPGFDQALLLRPPERRDSHRFADTLRSVVHQLRNNQ
jgi:hypothetical protein